jgi:hypothetical protein
MREKSRGTGRAYRSDRRMSALVEHSTRRRLPAERVGLTRKVEIYTPLGTVEGYIIANKHPDGHLSELFIQGFGKEGSTLEGWVQLSSLLFSVSLQYGAEFPVLARKIVQMHFEPFGKTSDEEIPWCASIPAYIVQWLALRFGTPELSADLTQLTAEMREISEPQPKPSVVELLCPSCLRVMQRLNGHWQCTCGARLP